MERVQILKAGPEFGGRTCQLDNFVYSVALDLGAEGIHVQPSVLERLLLPFDDDDNNNSYTPAIDRKVAYRNGFRWFVVFRGNQVYIRYGGIVWPISS
jgi:hypothetical protein